jgi:hypothetical protein
MDAPLHVNCANSATRTRATIFRRTLQSQRLAPTDLAIRHGVVMLSVPSHGTHQMQTLHVTFSKPFNRLSSAREKKLREKERRDFRANKLRRRKAWQHRGCSHGNGCKWVQEQWMVGCRWQWFTHDEFVFLWLHMACML